MQITQYDKFITFKFKSKIIIYDRTTRSFNIFIKKVSFGSTTIINYKSFNILELLLGEINDLTMMHEKKIEHDEPNKQFGKKFLNTKPSITKTRELPEINEIIEDNSDSHNESELCESFLNFIKNKVDNHYYEYIKYILYNLIFVSYLYKDPDDVFVDCTYYINYQDFKKKEPSMTRKGDIIKIINRIIFDIIK